MNTTQFKTLKQIEDFLSATQEGAFSMPTKAARYGFIQTTLKRFKYRQLSKGEKGLLLRFLSRVSGYSKVQIKRLVKQYRRTGKCQRKQRTATPFTRKYTTADIRLLAQTDKWHGTLSGPATKKLFERAYTLFDDPRYERLATLSVAHLYNLRHSLTYTRQRVRAQKTHSVSNRIAERRKPRPNGQPGYIRIDSVHQGELDRKKGVYHINATDEVTQFEVVFTVEKISGSYLIPALEELLDCFPFVLNNFHADNGSEYINQRLAILLQKLLIEFTKSRSRKTNDNALAESKNGSVVRKVFGYIHIPQRWAPLINAFNQQYLTPYLNYHRPCFFPKTITDNKGKQRKIYPYEGMMTPYDKFKSLPHAEQYLKPAITFEQLDAIAYEISDNDAAKQLQEAKQQLFKTIFEQNQVA